MSGESKQTTDVNEIRQWAEARGGQPAAVKGTGSGGDPGILRIDFADGDDDRENLDEISWEEFERAFEENNLAFVYQEQTADGEESRFGKFVSR